MLETVYEIQRIKQIVQEVEANESYVIRSPEDAAKVAASFVGDEDREVFFLMCLNTKNQVVAVHRVSVGSINATIVTPREVMKTAILNNAASIIISHIHPSQDTTESSEDIDVTKRLNEVGKLLGIPLLDHVIVNAKAEFTSFKEKGHI